ncbi:MULTISPECIES: hypothetical protein [Brevibacterium]|uniref:ABC-2 type transport system permease protein n=2 Tax=Brevibacterium TaxID=1696 RepID=A0A1H1TLM4_BRESA|nr:hypothetical protein [Brevibacterium sandarakinum]SDS60846.1 hypothetical protein SAMN04489751_2399 [Brevibacterium sandarakinum]
MSGSGAGAFVRSRHAGIGRAFGSTTMAVYVITLFTIFLSPMLINLLVVILDQTVIAAALSTAQPLDWAFAGGLVSLVALAVGELRGPIAPGRFEATVRLQSPQPRWRSLGPTSLRAFVATALVLGAAGLALGAAGSISLDWSVGTVGWMGLGGVVLGMACADARLIGQAKVAPLRAWCSSVLGATSVLAIIYDVFAVAILVEIGLLALSAPWLIPFCLTRLRTETVLRHSALAEAASTLTRTGDWSAASRGHRSAPSTGRAMRVLPRWWTAAVPRTPWGLWLSAWRAPRRPLLGILLIALGALLIGCGISLDERLDSSAPDLALVMLVLAAALTLIHLGFGAFTDSLEFVAETAGCAPLFRLTAGAMLTRSGAAYTTLMLVLTLPLICLLGALVTGSRGLWDPSLGGTLVLGLIQIAAARIHAATKGPLPVQMTTPIPTPAGDISVLMILAWQFDAVAYGPLAAAVIVTGSLVSPWSMLASVVLILLLARGAQKRLRR